MRAPKGLHNTIVDDSKICEIDPVAQNLIYRHYSVDELIENCSFDEVAYLLLYGDLPNIGELDNFLKKLKNYQSLPEFLLAHLRLCGVEAHPLDCLRFGVSCLSCSSEFINLSDIEKSLDLLVKIPLMIAAIFRFQNGKSYIPPIEGNGSSQNFFYMLKGVEADEENLIRLEKIRILHAEHGFNAATFSARIAASTESDFYSCIISAMSTFRGSIHGGAIEHVMDMLEELGPFLDVEKEIRRRLHNKEKIMGFGHRVYQLEDFRSKELKKMLIGTPLNNSFWMNLIKKIESVMSSEINLYPNVDLYMAPILNSMSITSNLFPSVMVMSRNIGWSAHIFEQRENNKLIRPKSNFLGMIKKFLPLEERDLLGL